MLGSWLDRARFLHNEPNDNERDQYLLGNRTDLKSFNLTRLVSGARKKSHSTNQFAIL